MSHCLLAQELTQQQSSLESLSDKISNLQDEVNSSDIKQEVIIPVCVAIT